MTEVTQADVAGAAPGAAAGDGVSELLRRARAQAEVDANSGAPATGSGSGSGSGKGDGGANGNGGRLRARGRGVGVFVAKRGRRTPTSTYRFGASRRESHDASGFYERFPAPTVSEDDHVNPPVVVDQVWTGDARSMDRFGEIADASVALVVTSPPYYAGKEYETAIGEGHVPASYIAYVEMLHDVFAECWRKLEPGGRIAVNVANLGRKPYRSLSADVIDVLQDLGFLLRGEVIWVKGKAAGGSCAWGTFQRPGNPVLRDVSERIIVASKGRFDRARAPRDRAGDGLPSVATISADEFMELTTDVWEFPPESATRVGHPAPFPVELPRRLIDLYTYEGDLVLDPFMGSGSTAVAAIRTGRHYVGFDTDPAYVAKALARIEQERTLAAIPGEASSLTRSVRLPAVPGPTPRLRSDAGRRGGGGTAVGDADPVVGRADEQVSPGSPPAGEGGPAAALSSSPSGPGPVVDGHVADAHDGAGPDDARFAGVEQAVREGRKVKDVARLLLEAAGFRAIDEKNVKPAPGAEVTFRARDARGDTWWFDLVGGFSNGNPGLRRADTLWKTLGKASVIAATGTVERLVVLTVERPLKTGAPAKALAAVSGIGPGKTIADVVCLCDPADQQRLRQHATGM